MDKLLKIRVAIWVMVLALWGVLVYQFLGENPSEPEPRMQTIAENPFPKAAPEPVFEETVPVASKTPATAAATNPSPSTTTAPSSATTAALTPEEQQQQEKKKEEERLVQQMPTTPLPAPWNDTTRLATAPPPGHFIQPIPPRIPSTRAATFPTHRTEGSLRRHEYGGMIAEPETPEGFVKTETEHFYVFSEGDAPPDSFIESLEHLHENLMIDLAAFSPWARDERVSIYLFRSQDSYRRVTGRPAWSGGASSVSRRKIYLYESDELMSILAHEMCHIYFDSFFLSGTTDPLWLSEGMATLIQVERGMAPPNWLPENLDLLYRGGGFKLDDLMRVDNTAGANDDNVRLWYTQSYSVVRFLIRSQWKSAFFHFCSFLRDGVPVQIALYRAYGMPFNRIKALEYAWRYDLETKGISRLRNAPQ